MSQSAVAKKHKVTRQAISYILKNDSQLIEMAKESSDDKKRMVKEDKFKDLEDTIVEFIQKCNSKLLAVDGLMVQAFAEKQIEEKKINGIKASLSWIYKVMKRRGMTTKMINGESSSVDLSSVEKWKLVIPELLEKYSKDCIYNVDETALFWKKSGNRTFCLKGEEPKGCKARKERLTILLGTSASGEKLPIVVIGKSKNPRPFKGTNAKEIVDYKSNSNGWMTGEIFKDWLTSFDEMMEQKKKKVLLLLDNFSGHQIIETKNIELRFLPPNTTAITQPMDAGIIKNFKDSYKKLVNRKIIDNIDDIENVDQQLKQLTIFDAVVFTSLAWSAVEKNTIINCWKKVGFV